MTRYQALEAALAARHDFESADPRTLAHNFGNTERLFICEGDAHCVACKLWGEFSERMAARVVELTMEAAQ